MWLSSSFLFCPILETVFSSQDIFEVFQNIIFSFRGCEILSLAISFMQPEEFPPGGWLSRLSDECLSSDLGTRALPGNRGTWAWAGRCHPQHEMESSLSKNTHGERKSSFYLNIGIKHARKCIPPNENSAAMVELGEKQMYKFAYGARECC